MGGFGGWFKANLWGIIVATVMLVFDYAGIRDNQKLNTVAHDYLQEQITANRHDIDALKMLTVVSANVKNLSDQVNKLEAKQNQLNDQLLDLYKQYNLQPKTHRNEP